MPAESERQRKFMAVERARKRAGKKTKTGMSDKQLTDFMRKDASASVSGGKHKGRHSKGY